MKKNNGERTFLKYNSQKTNLSMAVVLLMILGFVLGFVFGQIYTVVGIQRIVSSLQIEELNIDFNETLMTNAIINYVGELDLRNATIKNKGCTYTEKGYCATECYVNNKLIPCESFTSVESFCNDGICRVDGVVFNG